MLLVIITNRALAYSEALFPIYESQSQVNAFSVTKSYVLHQLHLLSQYSANTHKFHKLLKISDNATNNQKNLVFSGSYISRTKISCKI